MDSLIAHGEGAVCTMGMHNKTTIIKTLTCNKPMQECERGLASHGEGLGCTKHNKHKSVNVYIWTNHYLILNPWLN